MLNEKTLLEIIDEIEQARTHAELAASHYTSIIRKLRIPVSTGGASIKNKKGGLSTEQIASLEATIFKRINK